MLVEIEKGTSFLAIDPLMAWLLLDTWACFHLNVSSLQNHTFRDEVNTKKKGVLETDIVTVTFCKIVDVYVHEHT